MDTPEPKASDQPSPFAAPQVIIPTSLDDIPMSETAEAPEPFDLVWTAKGKTYKIPVVPRYPEGDLWAFQVEYLALADKARTPKLDNAGKQSYPDEGCEVEHLRKKLIDTPNNLKNPAYFAQFAKRVPPTVVAKLHQELRLAAGMDADFFGRFSRFMNQEPASPPTTGLDSDSDSSQDKSADTTGTIPESEPKSPPSTSGFVVLTSKNGSSASRTPSGSEPSPSPSQNGLMASPRTPPSATS